MVTCKRKSERDLGILINPHMVGVGSLKTCSLYQAVPVTEDVGTKTHPPIRFWSETVPAAFLFYFMRFFQEPGLPAEGVCPGSSGISHPLFPRSEVPGCESVTAGMGRVDEELIVQVLAVNRQLLGSKQLPGKHKQEYERQSFHEVRQVVVICKGNNKQFP